MLADFQSILEKLLLEKFFGAIGPRIGQCSVHSLKYYIFYRERQNQEMEKQKEKDRMERDKQEREKLERERQEKERELEKERQEQALQNHFEKSLRAAQQRVNWFIS